VLEEEEKNQFLQDYWESLKQGREFPSENDLDPDEIEELWDGCFLMQFRDIDNVQDCNFSYLGEAIIHAYEEEILPRAVPGLVDLKARHLVPQFQEVREKRRPMISQGDHQMPDGRKVRYHQCLLPLSYDGEVVHSILGRMGYEVTQRRLPKVMSS
jgi:hypothetical protein